MAEQRALPAAGEDDVLTGTVISPDDWRPYSGPGYVGTAVTDAATGETAAIRYG